MTSITLRSIFIILASGATVTERFALADNLWELSDYCIPVRGTVVTDGFGCCLPAGGRSLRCWESGLCPLPVAVVRVWSFRGNPASPIQSLQL